MSINWISPTPCDVADMHICDHTSVSIFIKSIPLLVKVIWKS